MNQQSTIRFQTAPAVLILVASLTAGCAASGPKPIHHELREATKAHDESQSVTTSALATVEKREQDVVKAKEAVEEAEEELEDAEAELADAVRARDKAERALKRAQESQRTHESEVGRHATDEAVQSLLNERVAGDKKLSGVTVTVTDGVAKLEGTMPSAKSVKKLEDSIRATPGVRGIHSVLTVAQ